MRDSDSEQKAHKQGNDKESAEALRSREVPYDEKEYFESFYRSSISGEDILDRVTLGAVTEPESRFHYNSVENAIIRAYARINPPPPSVMARTWPLIQKRSNLRLLDVGSGTGHWIDFFLSTFLVSQAVGVEITDNMCDFLHNKYIDRDDVQILNTDIASDQFDILSSGGAVDLISAIGVLFHIVEDEKWLSAIANLAAALKPGGLMFVGDEFGVESRAVQFHKADQFDNWREHDLAEGVEGEIRVNKRVRSLADWCSAAGECGLEVVDLVRTDREPTITTAENDILVLKRAAT